MSTDATTQTSPAEEWEILNEAAPDRITFEDEGDFLVGTYAGHEMITPPPTDKELKEGKEPEPFYQLFWRDAIVGGPDNDGTALDYVSNNAGFILLRVFVGIDPDSGESTDKVKPGTRTKVVLKKKIDVDQASPMKDYDVFVAKSA